MKVVVQRVNSAYVIADGKKTGEIEDGFVLLVCFEKNDTDDILNKVIDKIINLRIFEDDENKMNLNIKQIQGKALSVSQFTLSWDGKKGNRPSFENSMPPQQAKIFYKIFNDKLAEHIPVEKGIFGATMKVGLINDGPVTFHLDY